MATQAIEDNQQVSIGRVFSRTFSVLADNSVVMFGIALIFGGLPSVVFNWFNMSWRGGAITHYQQLGVVGLAIIGAIVSIVLQSLVQGALVRATIAHTHGHKASFGECIQTGLGAILPLIGLAILMGLGVGLGFILLIVPGVMLYCMWAIAAPALVHEKTGVFGAFSRSRALTKGARWKVFAVEAIIVIVYWIFTGIAFGLAGFSGLSQLEQGHLPISFLIFSLFMSTIVMTVWSTAQTSLYVELLTWKEGPSGTALADVFA